VRSWQRYDVYTAGGNVGAINIMESAIRKSRCQKELVETKLLIFLGMDRLVFICNVVEKSRIVMDWETQRHGQGKRNVHQRKDSEMISKTVRKVRAGAQIRVLKIGIP